MFPRKRQLTTALAAAGLAGALGLGLTGCGEPVEPLGDGSLALSWQISPFGCEDAGVDSVKVSLENAHRSRTESFVCDEGAGTVADISPANYELTVVGLNDDQEEIFISEPRTVTIGAEKVNETALVRLTAKPASVEVAWRFDNGRVCGANGVSRVEVAVYDDVSYEIARETFSCDEGVGTIGGLAAGDFVVEAIAEGDETVFSGIQWTTLKRGAHEVVDVELESHPVPSNQ